VGSVSDSTISVFATGFGGATLTAADPGASIKPAFAQPV
jgi:hypothetical protein